MEHELRAHLLACATAYAAATGPKLTTLGRFAANDGSFFERIADPDNTFTAKTYDRIIEWFSTKWPDDLPWPPDVPRPDLHPLQRQDGRAA